MIFQGSRYEDKTVGRVLTSDNRQMLAVFALHSTPTYGARFRQHLVAAGDRLDILAYRQYGSADEWWRIADANDLAAPDPLTPGTVLKVPL